MSQPKNPLQTFEPNLEGRDFAIGDLHGSYGVFRNLLTNLNFDPAVDRIFSVGDLVDRGPNSKKCLDLIYEPWFHTVKANHEDLMIECFKGGYMGRWWYRNGGDWGMEAVNDYEAHKRDKGHVIQDENLEIIDTLPLLEELPYLMTVKMKSGKKYHFLHAELPQSCGVITDEMMADPETVQRLATTTAGDGDAFLWNRAIYMFLYSKNLTNREMTISGLWANRRVLGVFNDDLSHIISGHSIMQKPTTVAGQTNIDTGAYQSIYVPAPPYSTEVRTPPTWAGLTCIELENWKFYKATETTFEEVEPIVFTKEEILAYAPTLAEQTDDDRFSNYDF